MGEVWGGFGWKWHVYSGGGRVVVDCFVLTLDDEHDEGVRFGSAVDEADVLGTIFGRDRVEVEGVRVRNHRDAVLVLPDCRTLADVLDELHFRPPFQRQDERMLVHTWTGQ